MGALFFDKPVVIIFMVDTNVFSYADFGSYLVDVTEVLRHLQQNWFQSAVTYLGFLITGEGITLNPKRFKAHSTCSALAHKRMCAVSWEWLIFTEIFSLKEQKPLPL
jgi:hypothetical protein